MEELKLYLVTDSDILNGRDFYREIENALIGGVTMLQLREKDALGNEFLKKAMKLRELTKKYNVKFIVNDRVDIAMLCDADGVHVGQDDLPCSEVRKLIGCEKILGVSARNIQEANAAKLAGADYIGVGAIFSTSTKLDAKDVGLNTLIEIKERIDLPIVAIGGITIDNMEHIKEVGITNFAVVSDILVREDIQAHCKKWVSKL